MKTTLREIRSFEPCSSGWKKLCQGLGTSDLDTEVTILQILEINGAEDAFWALRTQRYEDWCPVFEEIVKSCCYTFAYNSVHISAYISAYDIANDIANDASEDAFAADGVTAANYDEAYDNAYFKQWEKNGEILREYLERLNKGLDKV